MRKYYEYKSRIIFCLVLGLTLAFSILAQAQITVSDPMIDDVTQGDWRAEYGDCFFIIPQPQERGVEEPVGPDFFSAAPEQYNSNNCFGGSLFDQGDIDWRIYKDDSGAETMAFAWSARPGFELPAMAAQWNPCLMDFNAATWDDDGFEFEPLVSEIQVNFVGSIRLAFYFINGEINECRTQDFILYVDNVPVKSGTIGDFENGKYIVFDIDGLDGLTAIRLETFKSVTEDQCIGTGAVSGTNNVISGAFLNCEEARFCGDGSVDMDLGETCDPPTGYCTGATLPRTPCMADSDCPAGETCGLPVAPAGGGAADRLCRNGDGSPDQCTYCGDGIVQPNSGEECDDGNAINGDGCSNNCMDEVPGCEVMVTKTCVVPPPEDGADGCTPGYWKQDQHFGSWVGFDQDDDYETVFGVDASFTITLLGALEQGGGGEKALGRHAVAALLSASSPDVDYFTDVAGVIAIVQGAYATGNFESAKNLLDFENNRGCPLNSDSGTDGDGDNGSATVQQVGADECEVIAGTEVKYNYEIENIGTVNISEVEVIDDPDPGDPFEVPGSPIMGLAPGETVTLESTAIINETTTNEVTVTGNPGPQECMATDTAIVTVIEAGEGCTPGYWKQDQHFGSWVGFDQDDDYETVFGVDASFTITLLGALEQGGGGEKALGRHAVAALLNAANPEVDYFTDVAGVIAIVQGAYASGEFESAKDLLDLQNNLGCPLDRNPGE